MKGKTQSGFKFEIKDEAMNDMELVEAIADTQSDDELTVMSGLSLIVTKLLGKEKKKALYDHIRTKDGRVPLDALNKEVVDIFSTKKEGKNS